MTFQLCMLERPMSSNSEFSASEQSVVIVNVEEVPEHSRKSLKVFEYEDESKTVVLGYCMPLRLYRNYFGDPPKFLQFILMPNPLPRDMRMEGGRNPYYPYERHMAFPLYCEAWREAWIAPRTLPPSMKTLYRSPQIAAELKTLRNPHFVECARNMPVPGFNTAADPHLVPVTLPKGIPGFIRVRSNPLLGGSTLFDDFPESEIFLPINTPSSNCEADYELSYEDQKDFEELHASTPFILPSLKLTAKMIRDVYAMREKHIPIVACLDILAAYNDAFHSPIKDCPYELAIPAKDGIDDMLNLHKQITKLYEPKQEQK
uniref:BURP domain-containing protein n=1 Tax=Steinernema glaseri TaxID=37863 RepID=A0A1I7Y2M5_9BILA